MTARGGAYVIARGVEPSALLAAAEPSLPRSWELSCRRHGDAVVLVGGPDTVESHGVIAIGSPTRDPWGLPTRTLELGALVELYQQYGPAVSQLVGGPFGVADIMSEVAVRALNGILPLVFGNDGEVMAIGTPPAIVRRLLRGPLGSAGPGSTVDIKGQLIHSVAIAPDAGGQRADIGRLESDIARRAHSLGELKRIGGRGPLARWPFDVMRDRTGAIIALTHLSKHRLNRPIPTRRSLHAAVSSAWWQTALSDGPLYAPIVERPSLDLPFAGIPR